MDIPINENILKRFVILQQKGCMAHAYLFVGPADIGKTTTALAVAKLINCEHRKADFSCDECLSCRKINAGHHPDVQRIDNSDGEPIKIEQIRELLNQTRLKPFMAVKKVFIIRHVETLTLEAANAFLKTLEEPTPSSLLLLTSSVPGKVLATVRSRCHAVHFYPDSNINLADRLAKDYHTDKQKAHVLACLAEGCLGKARALNTHRVFERKNQLLDAFIRGDEEEAFIKGLLSDKEKTKEFLNILLSWVRDALLMKLNAADRQLIHIDRLHDLRQFQKGYSFDELEDLHQEVVKTCKLLDENLNIKIPLLIMGEKIWGRSSRSN